MKAGTWLTVLSTIVLAAGCSWTRVRPIKSFDDRETSGVPFYVTKPYLLVTNDAVQVVYLPDYSRGYSVRWGSILSRNSQKIQLENGVALQTSESAIDCTSIFGALGDIFKGAGKEAIATAAGAPPRAPGAFKELYEIAYDEKTGKLLGFKKVSEIK